MRKYHTFAEALKRRRSYYSINNDSPVKNAEIVDIIRMAVEHVPSAFNSQSTRVVLLLGEHHRKLWQIVKAQLKARLPEEQYRQSEQKINHSFACGYGTVLFFEERAVVEELQAKFPAYRDNFPVWSQQTSAMHQLVIWTMLEECGLGASLQHYNPLIDDEVHRTWRLPDDWELVAQMPFGSPAGTPSPKEYEPVSDRIKIFF